MTLLVRNPVRSDEALDTIAGGWREMRCPECHAFNVKDFGKSLCEGSPQNAWGRFILVRLLGRCPLVGKHWHLRCWTCGSRRVTRGLDE